MCWFGQTLQSRVCLLLWNHLHKTALLAPVEIVSTTDMKQSGTDIAEFTGSSKVTVTLTVHQCDVDSRPCSVFAHRTCMGHTVGSKYCQEYVIWSTSPSSLPFPRSNFMNGRLSTVAR